MAQKSSMRFKLRGTWTWCLNLRQGWIRIGRWRFAWQDMVYATPAQIRAKADVVKTTKRVYTKSEADA